MAAKVSVIVPVYNCEKYIKKCLNSLIRQTLYDIEIICINNNSTDNSAKIINNYAKKDKRIVLYNEEKQGIGAARNKGIGIATGEYIGFVDSDDWVSKDFFERLYTHAKMYNADISCASIRRIGFLLNSLKLYYPKTIYTDDTQEKMAVAGIPDHNYVWNKIYRRDKFNRLKLRFLDEPYFEDIEFSIRAVHQMDSLVAVSDTEYCYRQRYGSIVSKFAKNAKKRKDFEEAYAACYKYANKNSIKLKSGLSFPRKKYLKILNFIIWKIYHYSDRYSMHKLFGIIPMFTIHKS